MKRTAAVLALVCAAAAAATAPARAVDRSAGADVPKPAASGVPWSDLQIAALSANLDLAISGTTSLHGAHVGLYAIDAQDGRVLYERAQDDLFQPASTLKLVTGSAALDMLGAAQRFHTSLVWIPNRATAGDAGGRVVLRGGGDPFLAAADIDAAAQAFAAAEIGKNGNLRSVGVDDSRYDRAAYAPGWTWDDLAYGYAAPIGALAFEENVVHLTVTPAAVEGTRAIVSAKPFGLVGTPVEGCPPTAQVRIVTAATTGPAGTASTIDVTREPSGCIVVSGSVGLGIAPVQIDAAVPSPARYAYDALSAALAARGAGGMLHSIAGPFPDEGRAAATSADGTPLTVWSHDSEPLGDTLADMWLPSDNLIAEVLLHELALAPPSPGTLPAAGPATFAGGAAREAQWLRALGVDAASFAISDGSGLSQYDRITPRALVTVLRHDWSGAHRELVLDDLPIAGVRGTLADGFGTSDAAKRVFAKTGSMSHVGALAGYVATASHGTVIVAIMADEMAAPRADYTALRNRLLADIADQ